MLYDNQREREENGIDVKSAFKVLGFGAIILFIFIGVYMAGMPRYKVWQMELAGKAQLKQAEWNRQIQIKEAEANLESQKLNAKAEVERAKGVAESNGIITVSLDEQYLRYLWIQGLHDGSSEVIYIPTEANMPLLEARDNRGGI